MLPETKLETRFFRFSCFSRFPRFSSLLPLRPSASRRGQQGARPVTMRQEPDASVRPVANLRRLCACAQRLILSALLALPLTAQAGGIDRLHHFLDTAKTLRADFTQTVTARNDAHGRRPQESSGVMIFSRPGKFRWQIDKPYSQLLVGDGKQVWIYDPELRQVTVKKMDAALGSTPAALLAGGDDGKGGKSTLEKNFTLHEAGERDGLTWVEARPKNSDSGFERLQLGFSGNTLKAMELFDNFGQTTRLRFSNLEHNPALDPSLLRFTPPEGADVIRE